MFASLNTSITRYTTFETNDSELNKGLFQCIYQLILFSFNTIDTSNIIKSKLSFNIENYLPIELTVSSITTLEGILQNANHIYP